MKRRTLDPGSLAFQQGRVAFGNHPLFAPMDQELWVHRSTQDLHQPKWGWVSIDNHGCMHVHPTARLEASQWTYVLAHAALHLALGHIQERARPREWNLACCASVDRWLRDLKIGEPPPGYSFPALPTTDEEKLFNWLQAQGIPKEMEELGMAGGIDPDFVRREATGAQRWGRRAAPNWSKLFALGLQACVEEAVEDAGGKVRAANGKRRALSAAELAKRWFIGAYPLMGAMAAGFEVIEDQRVCHQEDVRIAAVCPESREIFINPSAGLDENECRFVMAHELLHVGLRHVQRRQGRDAYLWNVACDYVINGWLVEMAVGTMPNAGLYDSELKGMSAESVYDLITRDLRRFRKLQTFRGDAVDVIERTPSWWELGVGTDLDAFYRRALSDGWALHQAQGRSYLPAGLIEEIRALSQPPIPWDVELAHWFDQYFQPIEMRRTYSRLSRRQSASPDIPRPHLQPLAESYRDRTFGVVLDTSGSMGRNLMAKGLGAITSYCLSRDVPLVRLVFCDAVAYDEGYVTPEAIGDRVRVRGRGGTILQPGIDLLENSSDFPKGGPILVITDGECDVIRVRGEHGFLIPPGATLPFAARGPIFRMK